MKWENGGWFWGRVPLSSDGEIVFLQLPERAKYPEWIPHELFFAAANGLGLLIGDGREIILYTVVGMDCRLRPVADVLRCRTFHITLQEFSTGLSIYLR